MRRAKKKAEPDSAPGAPEWMVTFSDCMTLLLTFFVLLLSFASFDTRLFPDLKIIYTRALTSVAPTPKRRPRDALSYIPPVRFVTRLQKGSETPTAAQESKNALMEETGFADLQGGIVFLVPSNRVFWGKGKVMSPEGRHVMTFMASFLKRVPGRVVVSETGPSGELEDPNFGLPRAWVIMEYLTKNQGLDKNRFSLSLTGIVVRGSSNTNAVAPGPGAVERTVEITLLERNTYN